MNTCQSYIVSELQIALQTEVLLFLGAIEDHDVEFLRDTNKKEKNKKNMFEYIMIEILPKLRRSAGRNLRCDVESHKFSEK
jgi:hypothetical protein